MIERGACFFLEKITRAYNNGAVGAIVYNSVAGGETVITMGSPNGLIGEEAPIPGFFVARSAGLTLAVTAVNVKIQAASFRALKDGVTALVGSGTLTHQQAGSLKDVISAAETATSAGDFATALGLISQFRQQILALRDAGVLPLPDWRGLDDAAGNIATRLQPPFTTDSA